MDKDSTHTSWVNTIVSSQNNPAHVYSIKIIGSNHTKPSVYNSVFTKVASASTFGEIIYESRLACDHLARLGIYKSITLSLDAPALKDNLNRLHEVDVIVSVEERPRLYAKTGTEIGNNEGNMVASLNLRNVFGKAESLETNLTYGVETNLPLLDPSVKYLTSQSGSSFQFKFNKPINVDPNRSIEVGGFKTKRNLELNSSHDEKIHGITATYKMSNTRFGDHQLKYGAFWRHIHNISDKASWSVRKDAGHSLKSSISHEFLHDSRNDHLLPSKGSYIRTNEEFSGLGGDVSFIKGEFEGQKIFSLPAGFNLSTSLRFGALLPWKDFENSRSRINDKFFLGGPLTIRGFKQNGIGPKDGNDIIGGDTYWAAGLSLFTPLPYLSDNIKGHIFINSGNLKNINPEISRSQNFLNLIQTPSVSCGLGLAVKFSIMRLEMNYCTPVVVSKNDGLKTGLNFGIGQWKLANEIKQMADEASPNSPSKALSPRTAAGLRRRQQAKPVTSRAPGPSSSTNLKMYTDDSPGIKV
ncbi:hypothetical protein HK096_004555, partial [Nowakowskiella sp. JEL0078]